MTSFSPELWLSRYGMYISALSAVIAAEDGVHFILAHLWTI